ncbi:DUF2142 domain-containing protein [Acidisoma cellulosilytica]|uniref:DUF2142 domain-containing protein n=1 Tax=Acidisoma cellulosilyticum TaxID=2802395 RepID=A0A963YX83_9PROT|nr:DUF2142 domain-containing protein [Acidisoma cellulosilyticum]MCB8878818.1 DUF2142 domain-containing protein [Acidisoma cellulosilyticum]
MTQRSDRIRLIERFVALACFLILVVPLVVYCAWKVPLGQVPDEPNHIARVDSVLRGEVIGYRLKTPNPSTGAPNAGVTGNYGLIYAAAAGNGANAPLPASASAQQRLAWAKAIPWSPAPGFLSSVNTAAYAPIAYIPAALALGVGISRGDGPHDAALAARFGNVIAFTILGCLALLLAGRGRLLLLVTLGLPITIWLAGSCNQDGVLIAVAVLALALLTRQDRAGFWGGTILLAVLALQKPPFLTLMLLPLVLPTAMRGTWAKRISAALAIMIPAVLWSLLVMWHVSVPLLPSAIYHPGPLWAGDPALVFHSAIPAAQISVLLHHPLTVALLPLADKIPTITTPFADLIGILGSYDIRLPSRLYALFSFALLSAAAALLTSAPVMSHRSIAAKCWAWALVLIAALSCAELIYLVEYLTWTPVGFNRIDGIQGRYFVPLLPILALLLGRVLPIPARFGWIWWILPLVALIALDAQLPGIITQYYYR